jgi:CelD/BcsL family acetyltransferase involved in cellulose biosynthesis
VLPYAALVDGFDAWYASRSANFRQTSGRRERRLAREHRVVFRMTDASDPLDEHLDTFFALHDARWAGRGGSLALPVAGRPFHRAFAAAALEHGWLRLWRLEVDGVPAASWYGWHFGERYCYYQSGFDPTREHESVGTVLLLHTMRHAAAEGARVYDMLWGDEPYKFRLATGTREAHSVLVARIGDPLGLLLATAARSAALARGLPEPLAEPLRAAYRTLRRAAAETSTRART